MKKEKGITLIALIITIIVMLILVAVSVRIIVNSDLIGQAEKTADMYKTAWEKETKTGEKITINGKKYLTVYDYVEGIEAPCEHEFENGKCTKCGGYKITYELSNVKKVSGPDAIREGEKVDITLVPEEGYILPSKNSIMSNSGNVPKRLGLV